MKFSFLKYFIIFFSSLLFVSSPTLSSLSLIGKKQNTFNQWKEWWKYLFSRSYFHFLTFSSFSLSYFHLLTFPSVFSIKYYHSCSSASYFHLLFFFQISIYLFLSLLFILPRISNFPFLYLHIFSLFLRLSLAIHINGRQKYIQLEN